MTLEKTILIAKASNELRISINKIDWLINHMLKCTKKEDYNKLRLMAIIETEFSQDIMSLIIRI